MSSSSAQSVVYHNKGGIDQFGYSIQIKKNKSGKTYSVPTFVPELNVYQSLRQKAMTLSMSFVDAAGLSHAIALQPGDGISVDIFRTEDGKKFICSDFVIQDIGGGARAINQQGQSHVVNAIQKSAYVNMVSTVNKSYTGTISSILQGVCQDYLSIANVTVEMTTGTRTIIFPSCTPYVALDWLSKMALTSAGNQDSMYYFFGSQDGYFFKSYRQLIADANTHAYTVSVDKTITPSKDASKDVFRIERWQKNQGGHQTDRLVNGLYENELMQFNVMDQTFTTKKFDYSSSYKDIHVLSPNAVGALNDNVTQFASNANTVVHMGQSSHTRVRSDEGAYGQFNGTVTKFGHTIAQSRLIDQFGYSLQLGQGDTSIVPGDIIDITAPALDAKTSNQGHDDILNGKFLIVNVRHQITNGNKLQTYLDVFRDGPEVDVFQNKGNA